METYLQSSEAAKQILVEKGWVQLLICFSWPMYWSHQKIWVPLEKIIHFYPLNIVYNYVLIYCTLYYAYINVLDTPSWIVICTIVHNLPIRMPEEYFILWGGHLPNALSQWTPCCQVWEMLLVSFGLRFSRLCFRKEHHGCIEDCTVIPLFPNYSLFKPKTTHHET